MKKQTKKLQLNKQIVAQLSNESMEQIRGGALANKKINQTTGIWSFVGDCTGGCSDGCGSLASIWNCTKTQCSADCNTDNSLGTLSKMNACHTYTVNKY